MKFLLDTNILIPLEPLSGETVEQQTQAATDCVRSIMQAGHQVFIHPYAFKDIDKNLDGEKRSLRRIQLAKYVTLQTPPPVSASLEGVIGKAKPGSNDWVDHHLLAAVQADAVDYLVTEDQGLIRKFSKANLETRVLTLAEAATLLRTLLDTIPTPPPAVNSLLAYGLDERDPIFDSLRQSYPGFDGWLRKCKGEHRQAWTVTVGNSSSLAAVCIVNHEKNPPVSLSGKVLKVCTFKVSSSYQGVRFGELLLKTVFTFATSNKYDWMLLTAYPEQESLLNFLQDFGFTIMGAATPSGEYVLVKPMSDPANNPDHLAPLEYHVRYGPRLALWDGPNAFVVPIQPQYHRILFPEMEKQLVLTPGIYPFGNSIGKAYLCHAGSRRLWRGDNLFFYRSKDSNGITVHGVVEGTFRSSSLNEIARYVGKRTVYTLADIGALCQKPVLAILFRQARILDHPLPLDRLIKEDVLKAAPQSITKLSTKAKQWIANQIDR